MEGWTGARANSAGVLINNCYRHWSHATGKISWRVNPGRARITLECSLKHMMIQIDDGDAFLELSTNVSQNKRNLIPYKHMEKRGVFGGWMLQTAYRISIWYMTHPTANSQNVLEGWTGRVVGIELQYLLEHMMIPADDGYALVGLQRHTKTVYNALLLHDVGKVTLKRRIPTGTVAKPKAYSLFR